MHLTLLVAAITVLTFASTSELRYVIKSNSSLQDCPAPDQSVPCLTLDLFAQKSARYFTSGSTFVFFAGNHTLNTTVAVTNVVNLTLKSINTSRPSADVSITLINNANFQVHSVVNLTLHGLRFLLHSDLLSADIDALMITRSREVLIANSIFEGSGDLNKTLGRALHIRNSAITITNSHFERNTGLNGGALFAESGSRITLANVTFIGNKARLRGGAICASQSSVIFWNGVFYDFPAENYSKAEVLEMCSLRETKNESIADAYFYGNTAIEDGGALYLADSRAFFNATLVLFRDNIAQQDGGGTFLGGTQMISNAQFLCFMGNRAGRHGGGIYGVRSYVTLGESMKNNHYFSNNSGADGGGIYFRSTRSTLKLLDIKGNSIFHSNMLIHNDTHKPAGGAIYVYFARLNLNGAAFFSNNDAFYGGALYIFGTDTVFNATTIELVENSAEVGGAIFIVTSIVVTTPNVQELNYYRNIGRRRGGGLRISSLDRNNHMVIPGTFVNNTGGSCGGAVLIETGEHITFENIVATGNTGTAFCISEGNITFRGVTNILRNTGKSGGGLGIIGARSSSVLFQDDTNFINNSAFIGGAIFTLYDTKLLFTGTTLFECNRADTNGGALYALGTNITIELYLERTTYFYRYGVVNFVANSAQNGGAMFLRGRSVLNLDFFSTINASFNQAAEYGGAIYHEDLITPSQCSYEMGESEDISTLPRCFIVLNALISSPPLLIVSSSINSWHDSAGKAGSFLYGGLLDRCQMELHNTSDDLQKSFIPYQFLSEKYFEVESSENRSLTSQPYQLCFCVNNSNYDCSGGARSVEFYRGQTFRLSLLAFDQGRNITATLVTVRINSAARLQVNQSTQVLPPVCSTLTYNLFSTDQYEEIILYADGPCRDTGLAKVLINVTLLPCPDAFTLSGERCGCEERLEALGASCEIDETIYITRKAGSKFWIGTLYVNGSYKGLITHGTCPVEYCKETSVNITLDNMDAQCSKNRVGLLCGSCAEHYSLMFGSSRCRICPNTYLTLLLPFLIAGIALVAFMSVLRLTVSTGMINSLILYANILQANRKVFLPTHNNILTVFIAWMNLDLGFETCFYDGMDAYTQTWFQFAFPVYIWVLIGVIILTSRYSITLTKLIGSNPVAVLSTLILMSYAKILKIIIEVYSFVSLDYPNDETVVVWLKDANVPYLKSKHLFLTIVTTLVLIFVFLPYTAFLLLGHAFYRYTGRKYFRWFHRIKPLLDSYYAPYKKHTRYWTGFLLILRCVLYIVFSFNSLGGVNSSLLSINIAFTILVIIAWLSVRIYKSIFNNIIEGSVYLNIILLSAATLADANTPPLVYTLVGFAFAMMMAIIVYHFHRFCLTKFAVWSKMVTKMHAVVINIYAPEAVAPAYADVAPVNAKESKMMVTRTVINLREPLLEN